MKQLKDEVIAGKTEVQELQNAFKSTMASVREELDRLKFDRERINADMQKLREKNEDLSGKYSKHSADLDNELINFPDNVEGLQELLLKFNQELIVALVAKEVKEEEVNTLRWQIELLQSEIKEEVSNRGVLENELTIENSKLKHQVDSLSRDCKKFKTEIMDLSMRESQWKAELENAKAQLDAVSEENVGFDCV